MHDSVEYLPVASQYYYRTSMTNTNEETIPLHDVNDPDHYRRIFNRVDVNQDGYICYGELYAFIQTHKNDCKVISRDIVEKIHQKADTDGDQQLDFEEFKYLITHEGFQKLLGRYVNEYVHFLIPHPQVTTRFTTRALRVEGGEEEEERTLLDEYSCCPPPIFLLLISVLEFAFYLTDEINKPGSTLSGSGTFGTLFIYDPYKREEAWRYFTYIFVHIGYQHLCVNLAVQLVLGIPLEMVHKFWRVLVIYCTGGIAGSLAHSIADPRTRLGGASGSVYALLTAHIANVIMNWGQMAYPIIQLFIFGVLVVCDVGTSVYQRYFLKEATNVGVAAHLGGAVAGLLVGIYALRNLKITNAEKYIWWIAVILYIILMVSAIIINIFLPSYFA